MNVAAEIWRDPVGKSKSNSNIDSNSNSNSNSNRFSLGVENEQAEAGRDGRTCLAGPNSQARTGTGECSFSLFS